MNACFERPALMAGRAQLWIVWYEARTIATQEAFAPHRATVVASGPDDAFHQAATELGSEYDLGFPIVAAPAITAPAALYERFTFEPS